MHSNRLGYSYNLTTGSTAVPASLAGARVTPAGVTHLRLAATQDTWVTIASSNAGVLPVATATTSTLIRAGAPAEHVTVAPGDVVSALEVSTSGTLNITEVT